MTEDNNEYYTGQKSKKLLVHVLQNGVEVDKPIKKRIFDQRVEWKKRTYPIVPDRFIFDNKGVAHQYIDTNDVSVLTIHKDHSDNCKKCGKRMTVDARNARELAKRGVIQAIWGIDSTHMILMIIMIIGAMAGAGFGVYFYGEDSKHNAQLKAIQENHSELQRNYNFLLNSTRSYDPTIPPAPRG